MACCKERYTLRAHLIETICPAHPWQRTNAVARLLVGRFIELDHHEGVAAALFSREPQRGDVESLLGENRGDARNRAFHVFGNEHDRVLVAVHLYRKTV